MVAGLVAGGFGLSLSDGGAKECDGVLEVRFAAVGDLQSATLQPVAIGEAARGEIASEPVEEGLGVDQAFLASRLVGNRLLGPQQHGFGGEQQAFLCMFGPFFLEG